MELNDNETPRVFVANDSLLERKLKKRKINRAYTQRGDVFLIVTGLHYFISQFSQLYTVSMLECERYICVSLVFNLFLCYFFLFLPKFRLYSTM
jgi:hypothetical protein